MGKKFCQVCSKKCKSYTIRIDENVYVHSQCFRCHECKGELELSKFYFKNQRLYCIKDFKKLFYPKCSKCASIIDDELVTVLGQQYHVNCLCCSFCKATLKPGDKLNFDGKNLICRQCTLISLRFQNIAKLSSEHESKQSPNRETKSKQSPETLASSVLESVDDRTTPGDDADSKSDPRRLLKKSEGESKSSQRQDYVEPTNVHQLPPKSPKRVHQEGKHSDCYLNKPLNFRRGPSFNVSHSSNAVHHFHVPDHADPAQRFSRVRSRTLPKTSVHRSHSRDGGAGSPKSSKTWGGQGRSESKSVFSPELESPRSRSLLKEERATSRDTLSKTPLPCISEDGISTASHPSVLLPSKGYALKPGYGLKPIMYAFYNTSPDSKQHLYSGAVSVGDSRDTKSISLGSECHSSFYSVDEDEKDPYTGLKRNRSTRSTVSHDPRISRSKTLTEIVSTKRPITVNHFLKKVDHSDECRRVAEKMTYNELILLVSSPSGRLVDRDRLEEYLEDGEFMKLFCVDKSHFMQLPQWKKLDLKKRHNLF